MRRAFLSSLFAAADWASVCGWQDFWSSIEQGHRVDSGRNYLPLPRKIS
jgi:hypothetical protein